MFFYYYSTEKKKEKKRERICTIIAYVQVMIFFLNNELL